VAQHCAASRGEYSSHETAIAADPAVADRIHASMQGVQAAAGKTMRDRTGPDPDLEQLGAGDHAVLALGHHRYRGIRATLTGFGPHMGVNPVSMSHGAQHPG
jgi:hypothetical protein